MFARLLLFTSSIELYWVSLTLIYISSLWNSALIIIVLLELDIALTVSPSSHSSSMWFLCCLHPEAEAGVAMALSRPRSRARSKSVTLSLGDDQVVSPTSTDSGLGSTDQQTARPPDPAYPPRLGRSYSASSTGPRLKDLVSGGQEVPTTLHNGVYAFRRPSQKKGDSGFRKLSDREVGPADNKKGEVGPDLTPTIPEAEDSEPEDPEPEDPEPEEEEELVETELEEVHQEVCEVEDEDNKADSTSTIASSSKTSQGEADSTSGSGSGTTTTSTATLSSKTSQKGGKIFRKFVVKSAKKDTRKFSNDSSSTDWGKPEKNRLFSFTDKFVENQIKKVKKPEPT